MLLFNKGYDISQNVLGKKVKDNWGFHILLRICGERIP